jgi:hypothetical protein
MTQSIEEHIQRKLISDLVFPGEFKMLWTGDTRAGVYVPAGKGFIFAEESDVEPLVGDEWFGDQDASEVNGTQYLIDLEKKEIKHRDIHFQGGEMVILGLVDALERRRLRDREGQSFLERYIANQAEQFQATVEQSEPIEEATEHRLRVLGFFALADSEPSKKLILPEGY